ncbi:MAG: baseplate J/gp47 family protein, partial [Methanocorpusculum sp.]|nr:baseplate J/gp47 family protein [Methanocorpusculum sp.]
MITKIVPVSDLKQMFLEILLNKTDKVSDISDDSVLNGIAYGCAKVGQRLLVNQGIVEGHLFPDTAYGQYLDNIASIRGVSPRFGACGSTTYVRVIAEPGTSYIMGVQKFTSTSGVTFELEESKTVDENGFAYIKVKSTQVGTSTNVDPVSINKVSPKPNGHISVTNEYAATGGMDVESDALFRQRIKNSVNALSRGTIAFIEQVFMKINPRVLRVFKGGITSNGKINLIICSTNGASFSQNEFDLMISRSEEYLSLYDILREVSGYALNLVNVDWQYVDVSFRVELDPSYDVDVVRKNIQIQMNKLFDYRFWNQGDRIEWDDLLQVAKNTEGVRYIPDNYFYPQADINVPSNKLPRIRGFIMYDLNGNIIESNNGLISDVY